ncbi:unnamed protein product [Somion occarium]|uniref:Secreted protein n=1 Tax=Somion occarium TaxID=3059160 RepID=A0ABP1D3D9_9APHY
MLHDFRSFRLGAGTGLVPGSRTVLFRLLLSLRFLFLLWCISDTLSVSGAPRLRFLDAEGKGADGTVHPGTSKRAMTSNGIRWWGM